MTRFVKLLTFNVFLSCRELRVESRALGERLLSRHTRAPRLPLCRAPRKALRSPAAPVGARGSRSPRRRWAAGARGSLA
jgi:hypothetical protein